MKEASSFLSWLIKKVEDIIDENTNDNGRTSKFNWEDDVDEKDLQKSLEVLDRYYGDKDMVDAKSKHSAGEDILLSILLILKTLRVCHRLA